MSDKESSSPEFESSVGQELASTGSTGSPQKNINTRTPNVWNYDLTGEEVFEQEDDDQREVHEGPSSSRKDRSGSATSIDSTKHGEVIVKKGELFELRKRSRLVDIENKKEREQCSQDSGKNRLRSTRKEDPITHSKDTIRSKGQTKGHLDGVKRGRVKSIKQPESASDLETSSGRRLQKGHLDRESEPLMCAVRRELRHQKGGSEVKLSERKSQLRLGSDPLVRSRDGGGAVDDRTGKNLLAVHRRRQCKKYPSAEFLLQRREIQMKRPDVCERKSALLDLPEPPSEGFVQLLEVMTENLKTDSKSTPIRSISSLTFSDSETDVKEGDNFFVPAPEDDYPSLVSGVECFEDATDAMRLRLVGKSGGVKLRGFRGIGSAKTPRRTSQSDETDDDFPTEVSEERIIPNSRRSYDNLFSVYRPTATRPISENAYRPRGGDTTPRSVRHSSDRLLPNQTTAGVCSKVRRERLRTGVDVRPTRLREPRQLASPRADGGQFYSSSPRLSLDDRLLPNQLRRRSRLVDIENKYERQRSSQDSGKNRPRSTRTENPTHSTDTTRRRGRQDSPTDTTRSTHDEGLGLRSPLSSRRSQDGQGSRRRGAMHLNLNQTRSRPSAGRSQKSAMDNYGTDAGQRKRRRNYRQKNQWLGNRDQDSMKICFGLLWLFIFILCVAMAGLLYTAYRLGLIKIS